MAPVADAPLAVRPSVPADVPALCGLVTELGYTGTPDEIGRRLARILEDEAQAVFVAARSGCVVGWLQVQATNLLESESRGEIVGLVVTAAERRRGVGVALVRTAEEWTWARGLGVIGVRSNRVRLDAHRFYERLGYAVTKTQLNFRKKL